MDMQSTLEENEGIRNKEHVDISPLAEDEASDILQRLKKKTVEKVSWKKGDRERKIERRIETINEKERLKRFPTLLLKQKRDGRKDHRTDCYSDKSGRIKKQTLISIKINDLLNF